MGTGWEYFNNVCRAAQAATRIASGALGLIVVVLLGWGMMQFIDASRAPKSVPAAASQATPAATTPQANPQFKSPQGVGAPTALTPTAVGGAPAATPAGKTNPQFPPSHATPAASADSHALPSNTPNPQFSKPDPK